MDTIILSVYKEEDEYIIEKIANKNGLKVVWAYQPYNVESEIGIKDLEAYYKLHKSGILIDTNFMEGDFFCSYPLINEISDYFMALEWEGRRFEPPKLFDFFDSLNRSNIEKMIIAFADEWNESTAVKIEEIKFNELKNRLYSTFVWCFGYRNLRTNIERRDELHPLVLECQSSHMRNSQK